MNPFLPEHPPQDETIRIWWTLSADPMIDEALRALHEHAATVVEIHRPVCLASGRCCQFKNHDHLLAVTGLEAAWTWRNTRRKISTQSATAAQQQGACAYLDGKLCSIHDQRPTGCRTYFCDRGDGMWQSTLSESLHRSIRVLHDERDIPYLCAEWTWLVKAFSAADERGVFFKGSLP